MNLEWEREYQEPAEALEEDPHDYEDAQEWKEYELCSCGRPLDDDGECQVCINTDEEILDD